MPGQPPGAHEQQLSHDACSVGVARVGRTRSQRSHRPAARLGLHSPPGGALTHERDVVDVAPAPVLAGFSGTSDGVAGAAGMARGVSVRRAVAASDAPAGLTHPQMHPCPPDRQAVLAPGDLVGQLGQLDAGGVGADRAHGVLMAGLHGTPARWSVTDATVPRRRMVLWSASLIGTGLRRAVRTREEGRT